MPGAAAGDPVDEVRRPDRRRGRHDHRTQLHDRQHGLPQLDLVAEHQHDRVTLADAAGGQPGRQAIRGTGHLGEGALCRGPVLLHEHQRRAVVAAGDRVEPVHRPVEPLAQLGPVELGHGTEVIAA